MNLDTNLLTEENLNSLISISPTEEEISLISLYDGDKNDLGVAEMFFVEMVKIFNLRERLQTILFVNKFDRVYHEVLPDIQAVVKASQSIKNSNSFAKILELILSIGNYMNGGFYFLFFFILLFLFFFFLFFFIYYFLKLQKNKF